MRRDRNNLGRQLRRTATNGKQAYATLLAVLAQKGGEVVITQGTLDQVSQNYERLAWVVEKGKTPNEFIVKLIEAQAPETVTTGTAPETTVSRGVDDADATEDTEMSAMASPATE